MTNQVLDAIYCSSESLNHSDDTVITQEEKEVQTLIQKLRNLDILL